MKAEVDSLIVLLVSLAKQYHIDVDKIGAHQFAHTVCPRKNMMAVLPELTARVKQQLSCDPRNPE